MAYDIATKPGKNLISGSEIAQGAIDLYHFAPGLFTEFRQIQLHPHTGVKSVRVKLQDLDGSFTQFGIPVRSPNGTVYRIVVSNAGVISAVTP